MNMSTKIKKVVVKNAGEAFQRAIAQGRLVDDPKAKNCADHYMYMGTCPECGDLFKHKDKQRYLKEKEMKNPYDIKQTVQPWNGFNEEVVLRKILQIEISNELDYRDEKVITIFLSSGILCCLFVYFSMPVLLSAITGSVAIFSMLRVLHWKNNRISIEKELVEWALRKLKEK